MKIASIDESIRCLMSGGSTESAVDRNRMSDGKIMFSKQDIAEAKKDLDIELRSIFHHYKIGRTYFSDKAIEYYRKYEGHSKEKAKSDMQNLIRTLERGEITNNRFEEAIRTLGFEIIDRSVTLRDDVGEIKTFSTSKARESILNES